MLEKPDLPREKVVACLHAEFGLTIAEVVFLPLGADRNTAVYRCVTADGLSYFLKLRRADFDEIAVALPRLLNDQGIKAVIAPLATTTGHLWTRLEQFRVILYPFIEGRNGYEVNLTDRHWIELGAALRKIHTTAVPPALAGRIPQETYTSKWRDAVRTFLERSAGWGASDPIALELAAFLKSRRGDILDLVRRTQRLALALIARSPAFVLCHSDLHAGNVLIDGDGALYIVDWDNPIWAPKERDLMFAGGGQGFRGHTSEEEENLFYQGYGPASADSEALAYYRYERIIQDIAIYFEELLLSDEGGEDRQQSLTYLKSNFLPNGTVEVAYRSDRTQREL